MTFPRTTKGEMETVYRHDEEERVLHGSTASPVVAERWRRLGYTVRVLGRYPDGSPRTWETTGPADALRLRRVDAEGQLVRRPPPAHAFRAKALPGTRPARPPASRKRTSILVARRA